MARLDEETLIGYQFGVRKVEVQSHGEDGQPLWNGDGQPKTEQQWILDLTETTPLTRHIVHIPLNEQGKTALVEALTGGIQVASSIPKTPAI